MGFARTRRPSYVFQQAVKASLTEQQQQHETLLSEAKTAFQAARYEEVVSLLDQIHASQLTPEIESLRMEAISQHAEFLRLRKTRRLERLLSWSLGNQAGEQNTFALGKIAYSFRWCPPGRFTMGSPNNEAGRQRDEDQVQVELTKGFWMLETLVTRGMWSDIMGTQPWSQEVDFKVDDDDDDETQPCSGEEVDFKWVKDDAELPATYVLHIQPRWSAKLKVKDGAERPATYVDWNSAKEFCRRLTKAAKAAGVFSSGQRILLPTESRWEYACRAGTTTAYSFGNDPQDLGNYAWFDMNAEDIGENYAHAVGEKLANPWGLLDMHGNVWEWCSDWYAQYSTGTVTDPKGPPTATSRVLRGGSWCINAFGARCSSRIKLDPTRSGGSFGFRVIVAL